MQRREALRRAAILERAAERIEVFGWFRLGREDLPTYYSRVDHECECAWTAIDFAADNDVPAQWRQRMDQITKWNDAQPGPEPVVAHLRASARRYREAAAQMKPCGSRRYALVCTLEAGHGGDHQSEAEQGRYYSWVNRKKSGACDR